MIVAVEGFQSRFSALKELAAVVRLERSRRNWAERHLFELFSFAVNQKLLGFVAAGGQIAVKGLKIRCEDVCSCQWRKRAEMV